MGKRKSLFLWAPIAIFVVALYLIVTQNLEQGSSLPGFTFFAVKEDLQQAEYNIQKPTEVVRQYFESWGNKDWSNMYATLSDGFKNIDPDAKDFNAFRNFASSQGIQFIKVVNVNEEVNDGTTAVIAYLVEFTFDDGRKQTFNDKFTLKFRPGDVIAGWKLTHPYGPNVDIS